MRVERSDSKRFCDCFATWALTGIDRRHEKTLRRRYSKSGRKRLSKAREMHVSSRYASDEGARMQSKQSIGRCKRDTG